MATSPIRQIEDLERRIDGLDIQLHDLESRLLDVQGSEERLRGLEEKLLDASARRIHDFERRLEHEWIALRQLHEEPLKTVEQRTAAVTENSLAVVRDALALLRRHSGLEPADSRLPADHGARITQPSSARSNVLILIVIGALVASLASAAYIAWRLIPQLREATARADAAEQKASELQQLVERNTRDAGEAVQRVTAEALISVTRTERMANVLAAPDLRQYNLIGQRTAAASNGHILWSPTRGAVLAASRLPALSSKETYQVWMTTTRGALSLGFVAPDAQGRAGSSFEAPAELSGNVLGFMLTLEPTGGNLKPTGPVVLAS
jgi:hypothetical protein